MALILCFLPANPESSAVIQLTAIAPEGTRKKVDDWKTGFYYIAKKAGVPILPIAFDWQNREMVFHPLFTPTESKEKDFDYLLN